MVFFITPKPANEDAGHSPDEHANKRKRVAGEAEEIANYYPKRVPRACDRCRLKKTRCSGGQLCARCKQDGVICVTTPSKKNSIINNPAYVHLVESQRDQLVQALRKILTSEDASAASKLKDTLVELGIDRDSLQALQPSSHQYAPPNSESSAELASRSWNDVFNDLDGSQIEAIESFCATDEMQDFLSSDQDLFDQSTSSTKPADFDEMCFWGQDAAAGNSHPRP